MSTRNSRPDAVVVIPTLTNTEGLKHVLVELDKHGGYPRVVVSNDPNNDLSELKRISEHNLFTEQKNQGFAKAVNDGVTEAIKLYNPTYIVILNDDVKFDSDWIKTCIETMEENGWAATAPILKRPDGSIENIGYSILPQGKAELVTDITKIHESVSGRGIDGITAAALVMYTDAFMQLDGFDETFFAYLEDVDLCLRMERIGMSFGVTPTAEVIHMGQQTSSKMSKKKAWLDYKNWKKLIKRHWSLSERFKYAPAIFLERLRNLYGVLKAS